MALDDLPQEFLAVFTHIWCVAARDVEPNEANPLASTIALGIMPSTVTTTQEPLKTKNPGNRAKVRVKAQEHCVRERQPGSSASF